MAQVAGCDGPVPRSPVIHYSLHGKYDTPTPSLFNLSPGCACCLWTGGRLEFMWPVLSRDSHGAQPYRPHCVFLCPGYNGHERPAGDVMAPVGQGFGE